jgi:UDP-N-acetylmuramoylalanine--D-glutamate ligase
MKNSWSGMRVLVIGAARQGLALARYLARAGSRVTLNDQSPADKLTQARQTLAELPVEWVLGGHPLSLLDHTDLVCVSGGVSLDLPILVEARRRGLPITNDSQIFMEAVPCPVIAITGSAGKTTTTTLVGRMAQAAVSAPRQAWVGGNIGTPLIDRVDEIQPDDCVVLELSSFQLELMTCSPHIAAVLNITPNHLDRHGSMPVYTAAKARILDFQTSQDTAVLSREDPGAWSLAGRVHGKTVTFGLHRPANDLPGTYAEAGQFCYTGGGSIQALLPESAVLLRGDHNRLNVLAACAIGLSAGFPVQALQAAVDGFGGVGHRLELVREVGGVRWYNDSIATAPERSMAAVRAFSEPLVLMLGGRDKNLPWEDLVGLIRQRVDHVVVFGDASEKITKALGPLRAGSKPASVTVCSGVEEAVRAAAGVAQPGSVVLFSPGGTSYDEFIDFEERGERYRQWVHQLS